MGGYPDINLGSHRRDDRHYNRKRRELRKHLPALREYLQKIRNTGEESSMTFNLLMDFSKQLTDSSIRVPMHVLLRGEDLMRRNVLLHSDAKSSIVEVVWRSQGFRLAVSQKLEDTILNYGNTTLKTSKQMEDYIYMKAKTKDEYLEYAARIILHLREQNVRQHLKAKTVALMQGLTESQESIQKIYPQSTSDFVINSGDDNNSLSSST